MMEKTFTAMLNEEFKAYMDRLDKGLLEAEKQMLHEKAMRGESCVYADSNGKIYRMAAKDVIAAHRKFQ